LAKFGEYGKEVTLPFRCNFCKGQFCVEHRPSRKLYSIRSSNGKKAALAIIAIFSIALLLFVFLQNSITTLPPVTFPDSSPDSTEPNATEPEVNDQNSLPDESAPDSGSTTNSNDELVNYALVLINNDRQSNGKENVTLSNINSAQIHADNMLQHNFFSHWDLNGYKPYMRYTLAGGQGSVSENCAWMYSSGFIDPKEALEDLQWNMMNDDADFDWGHRKNILDSFHNKVSIGVSYNETAVCLVQDFEGDYVSWDALTVSSNEVTMKGTMIEQNSSIQQVAIYYDNPVPLTVEQLMNPPFKGGYALGTFVGMVLPSGWESAAGITITAQVWTQNGQNFEIRFDLSAAFDSYGEGVYTLLLWTEDNYLTTYSVWYEI
jgi:uncharacterized protein YkwD